MINIQEKMKAKEKALKNSLLIFSVACMTIIFFLGSLSSLVLNKGFYDSLYEKTGAYERIDKAVVEEKTQELFSFFMGKTPLDQDFYAENEISAKAFESSRSSICA